MLRYNIYISYLWYLWVNEKCRRNNFCPCSIIIYQSLLLILGAERVADQNNFFISFNYCAWIKQCILKIMHINLINFYSPTAWSIVKTWKWLLWSELLFIEILSKCVVYILQTSRVIWHPLEINLTTYLNFEDQSYILFSSTF